MPVMWKTGHSLIKDKMKELHAPIAGEMSGHMFFTEGFYGHDDALYGAARLLRIVADSGQHRARAARRRAASSCRRRRSASTCPTTRKFGIVDEAVKHFRATHDVIDVDGVRVLFGDGWGLIRASNTQPITRRALRGAHGRSGSPRFAARWKAGCATQGVDVVTSERTRRRGSVIALAVAAVLLMIGRVRGRGRTRTTCGTTSLGAAALWRARAVRITTLCAGSAPRCRRCSRS